MTPHRGRRAAATLLVLAASINLVTGCGDDSSTGSSTPPPVDTPKDTTIFDAGDNYAPYDHQPTFEPDYNNLKARPWVEPVSAPQRDSVNVSPDQLEFPDSMTDVGTWEPGRLVVSGAGEGAGRNPFGFARRVVKVEHVGNKYIVTTTAAALEDVVEGDFQLQVKPEEMVPVDLQKTDLQWVVDNLYQSTWPHGPGEPLVDDYPLGQTPLGFWDDVGDFFGGAAEAVWGAATGVWDLLTTGNMTGSLDLAPTISGSTADIAPGGKLFLFKAMKYSKTYPTKVGNVALFIKGDGWIEGHATFKPGAQVGAQLGIDPKFWLNVDSSLDARLKVNFDMEAGVESVGGLPVAEVQKEMAKGGAFAQDLTDFTKKTLSGDPNLKSQAPPGGYRRPLFLSKPSTKTFQAGVVPVVVVMTTQVDLECGFQAKAAIKTEMEIKAFRTFKFSIDSDYGITTPTTNGNFSKVVNVTGGGEVSVSCGLIPRVNVFVYDTVGLFAGLRTSLVAKAAYESKCNSTNPKEWRPNGEVKVGLDLNLGLQTGVRWQLPGSSLASKDLQQFLGAEASWEPWNKAFPLWSKVYAKDFVGKGLGYCTPACQNLAQDGTETDTDCGGQCDRCQVGNKCLLNSDCSSSVCLKGACTTNQCGDGVEDGQETDIDCGGGNCFLCKTGKKCQIGSDCESTFCSAFPDKPRVCVDDHCKDGLKNADEGGVDCGGPTCGKCATGALASQASDCQSGFFNGSICVATACENLKLSSGETDVDCGGSTCAQRCGFQQLCQQSSDCFSAYPCHPTLNRCVKNDGQGCTGNTDCLSNNCQLGKCAPADGACTNGKKDGTETDVDCGGPSCNKCSIKQQCKVSSDCIFDNCVGGTCTAPTGLVSAWPFDGTGDDISGNGHSAVLLSGATYTSQAHSGGQALSFSGSAWAAVSQIDVGNQFTITGWVFVPDGAQSFPILGNIPLPAGGQDGFQLYVNGLKAGLFTGHTENTCNLLASSDVLTANTWQHVAVAVDRTAGTATLYLNGVALSASGCGSSTSFPTNKDLLLGGHGGGVTGSGALDDVRLYGSVLTATEIAAIAAQ